MCVGIFEINSISLKYSEFYSKIYMYKHKKGLNKTNITTLFLIKYKNICTMVYRTSSSIFLHLFSSEKGVTYILQVELKVSNPIYMYMRFSF